MGQISATTWYGIQTAKHGRRISRRRSQETNSDELADLELASYPLRRLCRNEKSVLGFRGSASFRDVEKAEASCFSFVVEIAGLRQLAGCSHGRAAMGEGTGVI